MKQQPAYTAEPVDKVGYTEKNDRMYSMLAGVYDIIVKLLPTWKRWLAGSLPYIRGPRVLEVSFGTGYLMTKYAAEHQVCGLELNRKMIETTRRNLQNAGSSAFLVQGNVEQIPFQNDFFDTVVCTMAFTGYPDSQRAMAELGRVLKPDGELVMVDIAFPSNRNWIGTFITRLWAFFGDIIRDMEPLFHQRGFSYTDREIGGFGSVHLFMAKKSHQGTDP
jgi:ubiquinone/menaquinone biosynthesis C-methylase UbiE